MAEQIDRALLRIQWNRMANEVIDPALARRLTDLSDEELMNLANESDPTGGGARSRLDRLRAPSAGTRR